MAGIQVVNAQARLVSFGDTQLKPGVNSVSAAVAAEMRKHPSIKELIAAGKLSIGDAPPTTKGLKVAEVKKLVGETHDPELLKAYVAEDARTVVAKAVDEQLKKIGPTEAKDGDKKEEA